MRVQHATEAATPDSLNEDTVVVAGGLVAVLDGVSVPAGIETGCEHSVAWYVDKLAAGIVRAFGAAPAAQLNELLAEAILEVRAAHGPACDLEHPGTHAASVGLLRRRDRQADYLVLSDVTLVLDQGVQLNVVTDPRFASAVAEIRRIAFQSPPSIGSPEHGERVRLAALARQRLTNMPTGYWIAAADPAAAAHAITGCAEFSGEGTLRRAAILTDGAADVVDRYQLLDWPALLDLAEKAGPAAVIRMVREAEHADTDGASRPRHKRHDDATLALCTFDGSDT